MTSQKLIGFARKELDRLRYIYTPNDWYEYKHLNSKVGLVFVSCKLCLTGRNKLSIFMRFDNPEKAILAGFRCNKFSGKYNFLFNTTKNEITYILEHILPAETENETVVI